MRVSSRLEASVGGQTTELTFSHHPAKIRPQQQGSSASFACWHHQDKKNHDEIDPSGGHPGFNGYGFCSTGSYYY
jgi:hypothetical protein